MEVFLRIGWNSFFDEKSAKLVRKTNRPPNTECMVCTFLGDNLSKCGRLASDIAVDDLTKAFARFPLSGQSNLAGRSH
jgi:hypothetical protein